MNFTEQQLKAIYSSNSNILVSAGAGSGKTAVLAQRVYKHIVEDHFNANEMLVVTFTNAAAAEMKQRIRNKLLEDKLLSLEERKNQISLLDSSYIMTFDAYALSLVKKYHYLLGLDSNVNIMDNSIIQIKTVEYLDELMEDSYTNRDPRFVQLIKDYCINNDQTVRDVVKLARNKLSLIYDAKEYINQYENTYYSKEAIENYFNQYIDLLKNKIITIREMINSLSELADLTGVYSNIESLYVANTYEEIQNALSILQINKLKKSEPSASDLKKKIKEKIDELTSLTSESKENLIHHYLSSKEDVLCVLELALQLNKKLDEYKKDNNSYEFNDVFKLAISLLDKNEAIQQEVKNSFKEILIDEYQDTNDLQDLFISKIENNNVYMVGDIKQSIYRFRNANPNLFKEKYAKYQEKKQGIAIDLTSNFRSRKGVLEGINDIFTPLMDSEIGGVDYSKGQQLQVGQLKYEENKKENDEIEILNYTYDKSQYPFDSFDKELVEAFIIGQDIEKKIAQHYQVADFDENGKMYLRDAKYSDFTILMDRGSLFDDYKKILTYLNIPCFIEQDEKISESALSVVIISFFQCLNCIHKKDFGYDFKYSYLSLARSFLLECSDSSLYDIVKNNRYEESKLYQTITEIDKNIESKTISDVLNEFVERFDVYTKLNKIGDLHQNLTKLDYFYQLAHTLSKLGYDYQSFDEYLNSALNDSNNEIKFTTKKEIDNAVLITNIHKSKGLEYNLLYLPTLTKKFNNEDIRSSFVYSKDCGLLIPSMIPNKGLKDSFVKELYEVQSKKEDIGEKIRLFYVALTRAKQKIIMIAPLEDKQMSKKVSIQEKLSMNSFVDMLNSEYETLNEKGYIHEIDLDEYTFDGDYSLSLRDVFNEIKANNETITMQSLNKIEPSVIQETSYSKRSGLLDKETIEKMIFGNQLHYYLQVLDFNHPDFSFIENNYRQKIEAFLNSELMKKKESAKIYKEYEFMDENSHGFIDLLMEYEDHFDIIDYKLKNIDDDNYRKQLNGYRKLIEQRSNKKVNCYLYSLMDETYIEVD